MPAARRAGTTFPFGFRDPGAVLGPRVAFATCNHDCAASLGELGEYLKGAVEERCALTLPEHRQTSIGSAVEVGSRSARTSGRRVR